MGEPPCRGRHPLPASTWRRGVVARSTSPRVSHRIQPTPILAFRTTLTWSGHPGRNTLLELWRVAGEAAAMVLQEADDRRRALENELLQLEGVRRELAEYAARFRARLDRLLPEGDLLPEP